MYTHTHEKFYDDDYKFLYTPSSKSTIKKFKLERLSLFSYLAGTRIELITAISDLFIDDTLISEFDSSSVKPYALDTRAETIQTNESLKTTFLQEIPDELLYDSMLANDITIQMPPVKEYRIRLKIKGIEKATPKLIDFPEV